MEIEFYRKNVYGVENTYVANPMIAKNIREISRRKTLDTRDMRALEALGFKFKEVIAPKE